MDITFAGFSGFTILAFMSLALAFPVKISATVIGAGKTTIVSSFLAIVIPTILTFALSTSMPWVIFFYPVILLLSFKIILDTGFIGAVGISALTLALYFIFFKLFADSVVIAPLT